MESRTEAVTILKNNDPGRPRRLSKHFHLLSVPMILLPALVFARQSGQSHFNSMHLIDLVYNCNFDGAIHLLDASSSLSTDPLRLDFYRAVIFWQKMVYLDSAGVNPGEAKSAFMKSVGDVVLLGEARLATDPKDTSALFYTGFALGYLAKMDAAEGDEFKAAHDGDKGLKYHRELLKMCPEEYDVYFSLALFNYYTGFLPWYLRPLLFILGKSGSKQRAYEYLNVVRRKGTIVKYEADDILGEFYGRVDKPDSVILVYHRLIDRFPGGVLHYYDKLTWVLGDSRHYNREARQCRKAIAASDTMAMNRVDSMYLAKLYMRLAAVYEKTGRDSDAIDTYRSMAGRRLDPSLSARAHFSLAKYYERERDPRKAMREYRWVLDSATQPELLEEARRGMKRLGSY